MEKKVKIKELNLDVFAPIGESIVTLKSIDVGMGVLGLNFL